MLAIEADAPAKRPSKTLMAQCLLIGKSLVEQIQLQMLGDRFGAQRLEFRHPA